MVDGQEVTTKTSRVVLSGEENKSKEEHEIRYVKIPMKCPLLYPIIFIVYLNVFSMTNYYNKDHTSWVLHAQ